MDPRDRADAALARARARGAFVVTPDDAVSPMDATNTQQIPRAVVNALDTNRQDGDTTMVIASGMARGQEQQPQDQHQQAQQTQPVSPALLEATPTQPVQVPPQPHRQGPPARQPGQPAGPRELDGLVPTVQQPANPRSTLSRRLEGD